MTPPNEENDALGRLYHRHQRDHQQMLSPGAITSVPTARTQPDTPRTATMEAPWSGAAAVPPRDASRPPSVAPPQCLTAASERMRLLPRTDVTACSGQDRRGVPPHHCHQAASTVVAQLQVPHAAGPPPHASSTRRLLPGAAPPCLHAVASAPQIQLGHIPSQHTGLLPPLPPAPTVFSLHHARRRYRAPARSPSRVLPC